MTGYLMMTDQVMMETNDNLWPSFTSDTLRRSLPSKSKFISALLQNTRRMSENFLLMASVCLCVRVLSGHASTEIVDRVSCREAC